MRIKIRNGPRRTVELEVSNDITVRELIFKYCEYIGLMNENVILIYDGMKLKFERKLSDYDIEDGNVILAKPRVLAAITREFPGPTHLCPYGCGRQIPNDFKGCTELLEAIPNFFD